MRLIDADKLPVKHGVDVGVGLRAIVFKKDIDNAPRVDPVKRGHWIVDEDGNIKCSECGHRGVGDNYCERWMGKE